MKHQIQDFVYATLARLALRSFGLRIRSGGCGLFGDFFSTLNGLLYCERIGVRGHPCWTGRCLYFDPARGGNAWDDFFRWPDDRERGSTRWLVLPYAPGPGDFRSDGRLTPREVAGRSVQRYGAPTTEVLAHVNEFAGAQFAGSEPVIGLHIRRTDVAGGAESRVCATLEMYDQELQAALESRPHARVFLATDDQPTIAWFTGRYGDRVCHRDCIRSESGASIHGHYDGGVAGSPFQKGLEVMVDALLLARCDFLIRGHSRVTCYSLCMNTAQPYVDVELKHLGVNRTPWLHEGQGQVRVGSAPHTTP